MKLIIRSPEGAEEMVQRKNQEDGAPPATIPLGERRVIPEWTSEGVTITLIAIECVIFNITFHAGSIAVKAQDMCRFMPWHKDAREPGLREYLFSLSVGMTIRFTDRSNNGFEIICADNTEE